MNTYLHIITMEYSAFKKLYKELALPINATDNEYLLYIKTLIKLWAKNVLKEEIVPEAIKLIGAELITREYHVYYWIIYYGIITNSLKVELIENLTVTKIKNTANITKNFKGIDTLPSTIHELLSFVHDSNELLSIELLIPADILSIDVNWQKCCELKHAIDIAKFFIINKNILKMYDYNYKDIIERAKANPGIISEDYILEMIDMVPY